MYLDFFKFKKNPFHITPDPDFLFLSPSHKEASASIFYGIEERKGFVAITGEVGVGKTTILRSYLEGTDPERIRIVYIFNAALSFDRLLKQIASELGIPDVDQDAAELVDSLLRYLIDEYKYDRNVVLIIDEAQNMPVETLERLRMLSNLETSQDKLLQIILVGQPEFEDKLNLPELRQLRQRIAIRCRIHALQPDESFAYIQHRLMKASLFHNQVFTKEALKRIVKEAHGIPRIINVLCDNALITGFGYQRNPVDIKIVREVIKDFQGVKSRPSFRWKFVWVPVLFVFLVMGALTARDLLTPEGLQGVKKGIFSAKIPEPLPAAREKKSEEVKLPVVDRPKPAQAQAATEVKPVAADTLKPAAPAAAGIQPAPAKAPEPVQAPAATEVEPVAANKLKPGQGAAKAEPKAESTPKPPRAPAAAEAPSMVANTSRPAPRPASPDVSTTGEDKNVAQTGLRNATAPVQPSGQVKAPLPAKGGEAKEGLPTRVVKKGDSVGKLLMDTYGRVDENLIKSFKELNPQIRNINIIREGEVVVLPKSQPEKP